MKDFNIYRNNEAKLFSGFSMNYENFKEKTGVYPINGFLVVLLGKENAFSKKIMKAENFVLTKTEKELLCTALEQHIESKFKGFRNSSEEQDVCIKVTYKGVTYFANAKDTSFQPERDIITAMSLYNKFYDPEDKSVIEIRYYSSSE